MSPGRLFVRLLDQIGALSFQTLRPGVEIATLAGNPAAGPHAAVLRYEPGARVPRHRHAGFEVIYVLAGSQQDERGAYGAGTLVVNREGDEHSVASDEGCTLLIFWEKPVEFV
jgi:anti-sigma factor ChrR (cupin superfamily)